MTDWEATPEGALALVIVLDQFPLNLFRGQAESFATEAAARVVEAAPRAEAPVARAPDPKVAEGPIPAPPHLKLSLKGRGAAKVGLSHRALARAGCWAILNGAPGTRPACRKPTRRSGHKNARSPATAGYRPAPGAGRKPATAAIGEN